ncbi:hypothetical protein ACIQC5_22455 [Paenarthrobacter sp. NPDC092416]|uniref:hypothetical protein n=1 Tax=Paenarthrobacter sp. NPDC092416 TaxID=3364386 RepID=UPI00380DE7A5
MPFASAGLYAADGVGVGAAEAVALEAGNAVVEPVSVGELLGAVPPWQPLSNRAPATAKAAALARTDDEKVNE